MAVSLADLTAFLDRLDRTVEKQYTLVAAGGTAMALRRIKESTRDIDFIVERGGLDRLSQYCKSAGGGLRVDLFYPGIVYINKLPPDYLDHSNSFGSFENLAVYALSIPDIIITKAARLSQQDIMDIESCRDAGVTGTALLDRYKLYEKNQTLQDNMTKILRSVFDVPV